MIRMKQKTSSLPIMVLLFTSLYLPLQAHEEASTDLIPETTFNKEVGSTNTNSYSQNFFETAQIDYEQRETIAQEERIIKHVFVRNNRLASQDAIIQKCPLKVGQPFFLRETSEAIKMIYSLGYFKQVKIFADTLDDKSVDIYIYVEENPKLTSYIFEGNVHLKPKEIEEKTNLEKVQTISEKELPAYCKRIEKLYEQKNYHHAQVTAKHTVKNHGMDVTFTVKEGKPSFVTRIFFKGNKRIKSKTLRKMIYSKEQWILSPLDKAGTYQKEMVEADKHLLEDIYHRNGMLHAKVTDTNIQHFKDTNQYHITHTIHEGDLYFIKKITIADNEDIKEEFLKRRIPLQEGQLYSSEDIRQSIETLKNLWGEKGYIFADVEPSINVDEEKKTVTVNFYLDLKQKVKLNRLTIRGNEKARDKVVRRQVNLEEGELITNRKMDQSIAHVKRLGFFDEKEGVNWKTTRIDEHTADLDLMLKEVRTGQFNFQLGFGGNPKNMKTPQSGLTGQLGVTEKNLLGSGIGVSLQGEFAKKHRSFAASIVEPWLFDKPVRGEFSIYTKRSEYEEGVQHAQDEPQEVLNGGHLGIGYTSGLLGGLFISAQLGYESIRFEKEVKAAERLSQTEMAEFQQILNQNFQSGDQFWLQWNIGQDLRNGLSFPTNGHKWNWTSRFAYPHTDKGFNYFKTELDGSWYTPLIGQDSLVLCAHGHLGWLRFIGDKKAPWRELFHVGGPATVRGYTYGQIGPTWKEENSLGSRKMLNVNVELIMPITPDRSTRAVVFYDGGAGWDTPFASLIAPERLSNNEFFYRHSVGVGVRITSPTPLQIDFGIKLNPSKKFRKNLTQMHLSMIHEF